jgi:alkylated DNA repair dioxygenase AlkB
MPLSTLPDGFSYHPDFLTEREERDLLSHIARVDLHAFRFQGFTAKRRVASFGVHYSFENHRLTPGDPTPDFLAVLRERSAALIGEPAGALAEALLTEYPPASGIGWHKDVAPFRTIVGVSLGGPCVFRLRRGKPRQREIISLPLAPRSAYVMSGTVRGEWEHHIPPTAGRRYSITFRTLTSAWQARLAS